MAEFYSLGEIVVALTPALQIYICPLLHHNGSRGAQIAVFRTFFQVLACSSSGFLRKREGANVASRWCEAIQGNGIEGRFSSELKTSGIREREPLRGSFGVALSILNGSQANPNYSTLLCKFLLWVPSPGPGFAPLRATASCLAPRCT